MKTKILTDFQIGISVPLNAIKITNWKFEIFTSLMNCVQSWIQESFHIQYKTLCD